MATPSTYPASIANPPFKRLEEGLERTEVFTESQKQNIRLKARDLSEERVVWESVPFRLLFEPNRRCNLHCLHCDIERRGTGDLNLELIERLLEEIGWGTYEMMPFIGGEPTLAPLVQIADMARRHHQHLNLITNGQRLTGELFESIADVTARLQFSLHSHRPETLARIMPGLDLGRVSRNIRSAVQLARHTDTQILMGMVVMRSNLTELEDYVRAVHDLGVRRICFQKLYPFSSIHAAEGIEGRVDPAEARPFLLKALDAAIDLGVFLDTNVDELFGETRNAITRPSRFDPFQQTAHLIEWFRPGHCITAATALLVEWDGSVLPCCRDHIVLGNLHHQSFQELWNGEVMQRLRASFYRKRLSENCRRCMSFYNDHS